MDKEQPSYYAVIPANVRYDNNLKANEKLMYGELTCLTNKYGYCYASNNYFAELYGVTPQAISKWIKSLESSGYISIEYEYKGKEIKQRNIRMVSTNVSRVSTNVSRVSTNVSRVSTNVDTGYQQKVKGNNTSNNNTRINNTSNNKKYSYYGEYQNVFFTEEQYQKLLNEFPNDYKDRIENLDGYIQSTGNKYKDCLATIRNWARKEKKQQSNYKQNKQVIKEQEIINQLGSLFED